MAETCPDTTTPPAKSLFAHIVGIVILIVFFYVLYYMFGLLTSSSQQWERAVYLFAGLESLAFAAAGFFFGREVHRQRAEGAEKRAEGAEKRAESATGEVTAATARATDAEARGTALATTVLAARSAEGTRSGGTRIGDVGLERIPDVGSAADGPADDALEGAQAVARKLFPHAAD